jgi:hypothetical protein
MIEIHLHIHVEDSEMKDDERYRGPRMDGQPVVMAMPGLGQGIVTPGTIKGQWGQELPQPVMATPPWMEAKSTDGKKVIQIPRKDWKAIPRQFERSA